MRNLSEHEALRELSIEERIAYYEREIRRLTPPKSYREQVLASVYQSLLQICLQKMNPMPDHRSSVSE
jgi:hypothetical protein